MKNTFIFFLCSLLLWSCDPTKKAQKSNNSATSTLIQKINASPVFSKSFTGFALYDPKKNKTLEAVNEDMYFTPASNTKILTCYTSLKVLGDSIPALKYITQGDSLIFWGTGDPAFLNPELNHNKRALDFLKSRNEKLFYAPQWSGEVLGAGWAWDDYNDYYSAERSAFPMFGNVAVVKMRRGSSKVTISPSHFSRSLKENKGLGTMVKRKIDENTFEYNNPTLKSYTKEVPFRTSNELTRDLLEHTVGKPIGLFWKVTSLRNRSDVKTIYSMKRDDMLSIMMKNSDNLVAEQLLYLSSYELFHTFNDGKIRAEIAETYLADSPDKLIWRDGSGLSRYNLFTPRSMVYVLDKMRDEFGEEQLFKIFPEGGVSGTIRNWYSGESSYVFAKTGTLSNKHCLSGYIKVKSGKTLIFSFMHNNYITGSSVLKKEMQVFLEEIRDNY